MTASIFAELNMWDVAYHWGPAGCCCALTLILFIVFAKTIKSITKTFSAGMQVQQEYFTKETARLHEELKETKQELKAEIKEVRDELRKSNFDRDQCEQEKLRMTTDFANKLYDLHKK